MNDITLVRVADGVYMEERDPITVMICVEEVLESVGADQDEELKVATFEALSKQYREAGFDPRLLKQEDSPNES